MGGAGIYFMGAYTSGLCAINMHVNDGRTDNSYTFMYRTDHEPKVGDELSQMDDFTVTPCNFYDEYENVTLAYSSGTAKITAINTSVDDGSVTIKFDHLKMVSGSKSITYNGTAVIPFNFWLNQWNFKAYYKIDSVAGTAIGTQYGKEITL